MVFLDTMGLVAYINSRDPFHQQARQVYQALKAKRVTTDAVLVEVGALLRSPARRSLALQLKQSIDAASQSGIVEMVHADEALLERAWIFYGQRPDKAYSLVDYLSFVVMLDKGITEAFTYDHHFEQEGFVKLL